MTITITLDKTGINDTTDQVINTNMLALATSVEGVFNNMFNGVQPFDRLLFTSATGTTIANGAIDAPVQALMIVNTENFAATDFLDTIGVSNNRFVLLKAAVGMTVLIRSGVGNITTSDGSTLTMTGNILIMAWCIGSQWAVIGNGTGGSALPSNFSASVDPSPLDDPPDYVIGSLWANVVKNSAYISVEEAVNAAVWKLITQPKNEWRIRASGATALGVGIANPTVANAPVAANDSVNSFVSMPSTAGAGNIAGLITTTLNLVRPAHEFTAEWFIKTGNEASWAAQVVLWIGLIDADVTNVDTLAAGREFIGFRFSSRAADTGWRPVLHDGTTQNTGVAIGTVVADTVYRLKVRVVGITAWFSVNDGVETALLTNFPSVSQDLGMVCRVIPVTASIRSLLLSEARVYWT